MVPPLKHFDAAGDIYASRAVDQYFQVGLASALQRAGPATLRELRACFAAWTEDRQPAAASGGKWQLIGREPSMGVNPIQQKGPKPGAPALTARVSVSYPTRWGQSVKLVGEGVALGEWQPSRGLPLECTHVGGALVWTASLALPRTAELTYKYVVVNEGGAVEDAETRPRTVALPEALPHGATISLSDGWQVGFLSRVRFVHRHSSALLHTIVCPSATVALRLVQSEAHGMGTSQHSSPLRQGKMHAPQDKSDPGNVMATSAFRKVIFSGRADAKPDAEQPELLSPPTDQTVLRLRVW